MPEEQPNRETMRPDLESVINTLQKGDNPARAAAAVTLGELGDPAAVPALITALQTDPVLDVCCNAAAALGRLGDGRAAEPLIAALQSSDEALFSCAGVALLRMGTTAVQPLIAQLQVANLASRDVAIMLLGWMGNPAAVEPLFATLLDEEPFIRSHAANALVILGEHARPFLLEKLTDPSARLRRDAVALLGRIGEPSALEALVQMLQDDDPAVRLQTVFALRALKSDAIVLPLIEALDDLDRAVRVNAAVALKSLGTAEALNAVMAHQRRIQATTVEQSADEADNHDANEGA